MQKFDLTKLLPFYDKIEAACLAAFRAEAEPTPYGLLLELMDQNDRLLTAGLDELRGREAAIEKEIARQCRLLRTVRAWRTEAEAACALMGRFELEANTATRFLPYHGFIFHHQVIHNLLISIFVIT